MKYVLIGCGRIAVNHIKAVLNNHLELAAVCDVKPEAMETLLAKHGLEKDTSIRRYTDYREMIEAEQPTLAAIATESGIHAEIALYCIAHGVNVIIEKPMAMSMPTPLWRLPRPTMSRCAPATRTGSIRRSRPPGRPWRRAGSASSPTAPSMCAGTGTRAITTRPPGAALGPRTEAA